LILRLPLVISPNNCGYSFIDRAKLRLDSSLFISSLSRIMPGCIPFMMAIFESIIYRLKKNRIKASKTHKFGNIICGLCTITDGVILILTLGNYNAHLTLEWSMYRRNTGKFCDVGLK